MSTLHPPSRGWCDGMRGGIPSVTREHSYCDREDEATGSRVTFAGSDARWPDNAAAPSRTNAEHRFWADNDHFRMCALSAPRRAVQSCRIQSGWLSRICRLPSRDMR